MRFCIRMVPCVMLVRGASQRARSTAPTVLAREMRRSALRFIRDRQSIRRYGALGLVAMPPCANRIRPGGVLPLAAPDSLWPRGGHASPLARCWHMSVSAGRVPRPLGEQSERPDP